MPLQGGAIPVGATHAPSGGTSRTIEFLDNINGAMILLINESAAYNVRKTLRVTSSDATADSKKPGGYGPRKVGVTLYVPKQLADLSYFTNKYNFTCDVHPEVTNAEIDTAKSILASVFVDADFANLLYYGSKA